MTQNEKIIVYEAANGTKNQKDWFLVNYLILLDEKGIQKTEFLEKAFPKVYVSTNDNVKVLDVELSQVRSKSGYIREHLTKVSYQDQVIFEA